MRKLTVVLICLSFFNVNAQYQLVQQLSAQINNDSLSTYVKQLTGILPVHTPEGDKYITSRYIGTAGNTLAAQFIKQKLESWNVVYDLKDFSTTGQNIIGKIEGRRPAKIMVVGAHYDAVNGSPGADDNASGTAAVLEMARVCALHQFPVSLHFAFWDEEEQGLWGSQASATDYMQYKLVGYINMDMIAYDGNNDGSFDIHAREAGYSIEMANRAHALVRLYNAPLKPRLIIPGDQSTDHGSFWQNNLTAIGFNEEYNGDFTPHWHRSTDSITKFNLSYFYRMSRFATMAFLHFAMDSNNLVGVKENDVMNDLIDVYPNPATSYIKISGASDIHIYRAELVDLSGKTLADFIVEDGSIKINSGLSFNGLYYLLLYDKNGYVYRKKLMLH